MLDQWQRDNKVHKRGVGDAVVSLNKKRVTPQKGRVIEERNIEIKSIKTHIAEEEPTPITKKTLSIYTIISFILIIASGYFFITHHLSVFSIKYWSLIFIISLLSGLIVMLVALLLKKRN